MSITAKHTTATHWRKTPNDVLAAILKAEEGVAELQNIANGQRLKRKFTLDGRLVGDIGELLLCHDFDVLPEQKSDGHAHDLVARAGSGQIQVQVKLRRATKGGRIEFKYQPECLVVIECSQNWHQWRILYNGPGSIVSDHGIKIRDGDRRILRNDKPGLVHLSFKSLIDSTEHNPPLGPYLAARNPCP